MTRQLH